jgi:hypothetical protein
VISLPRHYLRWADLKRSEEGRRLEAPRYGFVCACGFQVIGAVGTWATLFHAFGQHVDEMETAMQATGAL